MMEKKTKSTLDAETTPAVLEKPLARVTASQGLNLRAGPGAGFKPHSVLPEGTEVQLLPLWSSGPQGQFDVRVDGWRYIFTGSMVGWVDSRFLQPVESGDV